jgi:hypothetical protein
MLGEEKSTPVDWMKLHAHQTWIDAHFAPRIELACPSLIQQLRNRRIAQNAIGQEQFAFSPPEPATSMSG